MCCWWMRRCARGREGGGEGGEGFGGGDGEGERGGDDGGKRDIEVFRWEGCFMRGI